MSARKSQEEKALAGTEKSAGGRTDSGFEPLTDVPEAPNFLSNGHAVKEWNRLAPLMVERRLLTEANVTALGICCSIFGQIVQATVAGSPPNAAFLAQYRGFCADLGLTKAGVSGAAPAAANRFAKFAKSAA
jgi:hypothetical protein